MGDLEKPQTSAIFGSHVNFLEYLGPQNQISKFPDGDKLKGFFYLYVTFSLHR